MNLIPSLRWYQTDLKDAIRTKWRELGNRSHVMAVSPTGSGKGVLIGALVSECIGASCVMAHRQELIAQLSMSLARFHVRHRILAPEPVIRAICAQHLEELGACYYDPTAKAGVASVQSLTPTRVKAEEKWIFQVQEVVTDEAAHVLRDNIWGKAIASFPNACSLGLTATPLRSDGKGLGAHADGVYQDMVLGPNMRDLIDWGYIAAYRVIVAQTHIDLAGVGISSVTGDYVLDRGKGKAAVRKSTLVGDVVGTYRKYAEGKQALVFASDVETAEDMAAQFRASGVASVMLDGKTPDAERRSAMKRFRRREIQVVTSCEIFSEGLDIPGVEVVILGRPTMSFGLHAQQIGRALRLSIAPEHMQQWDGYSVQQRLQIIAESSKPRAIIIDHANNILNPALGLPDSRSNWTLDAAEKKSSGPTDAIPLTACLNCMSPFERFHGACPYCGEKRKPSPGKTGPAAVDGDMVEVDEEILQALRAAVAEVAMPEEVFRQQAHLRKLPTMWVQSHVKKHYAHRMALLDLQEAMAWYAGEHRALGRSDSEIFRRWFLATGLDWLSAQTADRETMIKLTGWIDEKLTPASSAARVRHMAG